MRMARSLVGKVALLRSSGGLKGSFPEGTPDLLEVARFARIDSQIRRFAPTVSGFPNCAPLFANRVSGH